ncbi:uncharacterized protein CTRU02_204262 [Colletotrichum truncatum]|uniref:Uncharacterized protein n=1 Tax=Colletotrichum truncatum TaxID=5467 RepID=A0ACC3ZBP5_COLTU|nr:uncharacterized protein CTRU02_10113 [Colletotrichum truncatum]KAF6787818.1 hypothetical protein CTRU02_10113 [Colletotrichum truncatum]
MWSFPALLALSSIAINTAASQGVTLTWRTATITQCYAYVFETTSLCNGGCAKPTVYQPSYPGGPIGVCIDAPRCHSCGCNACAQTVAYTTAYDAFCSTGLTKQLYAVTETYSGVSAKPTVASTDVPFGFTADVQTCTTCGDKPITATITRPMSDVAYITGLSEPFPAPIGAKPYQIDIQPPVVSASGQAPGPGPFYRKCASVATNTSPILTPL